MELYSITSVAFTVSLPFLYHIPNQNQENVTSLWFFLYFLLVVWGEIYTFVVIL